MAVPPGEKRNPVGRRKAAPTRALVRFEEFAEDGCGVFAEFAVVGAEGGEEVGVDVEFADDFAADEDGDDDFGFGFEGAGEIARVGVDVVNDDGFAAGGCGAADTLVERNAGVRRHGAFEGAEDERVAAFPFEHVEADPVVAGELFVKKSDDGFHEGFAGRGGFGERVELGNHFGGFWVCGCHRDYFSVSAGLGQKVGPRHFLRGWEPSLQSKSGSRASALQRKKWKFLSEFDSAGSGH